MDTASGVANVRGCVRASAEASRYGAFRPDDARRRNVQRRSDCPGGLRSTVTISASIDGPRSFVTQLRLSVADRRVSNGIRQRGPTNRGRPGPTSRGRDHGRVLRHGRRPRRRNENHRTSDERHSMSFACLIHFVVFSIRRAASFPLRNKGESQQCLDISAGRIARVSADGPNRIRDIFRARRDQRSPTGADCGIHVYGAVVEQEYFRGLTAKPVSGTIERNRVGLGCFEVP